MDRDFYADMLIGASACGAILYPVYLLQLEKRRRVVDEYRRENVYA